MMKMQLANPLSRALERVGGTQRWLAQVMGKGKSSVNNYMHDAPVTPNDAVAMATALDDDQFSMELGHMMLGLIKAFTGPRIPNDPAALLNYDEFEEREEKSSLEAKQIRMILSSPEELSNRERSDLKAYLFEKLDSTVMDITLLSSGAAKLDLNLMDLFQEREPEYIKKRYLISDEAAWQRGSR